MCYFLCKKKDNWNITYLLIFAEGTGRINQMGMGETGWEEIGRK